MCDHANREAAMVVVRRDDAGTPTAWCDPCFAPLIEALNSGGIETAASCCGHNGRGSDGEQTDATGWVMLRDGRTLFVADSPDLLTRARAEGAKEAGERIAQARPEGAVEAAEAQPIDGPFMSTARAADIALADRSDRP